MITEGQSDSKNVLIVEDSPDMIKALTMRLEAAGFRPSICLNGSVAAIVAKWSMPDLIILDLGLPRSDGFEVMREIRKCSATSRIPIMVLTGRDAAECQERSMREGATCFLRKPVRSDVLIEAINDIFAQTGPAVLGREAGDRRSSPH